MNTLDDVVFALPGIVDSRRYIFDLKIPGHEKPELWRILQADCFLPVLLALAEGLWRRATKGAGFGLWLEEDNLSAVGFRVTGIFHVPPSIALVALDAVLDHVADEHGYITLEAIIEALST